jgi:hypothetical protein
VEVTAPVSLDSAYFAQGYRCGHLEGKARVGAYVIGEELPLAWEAAEYQNLACLNYERDWATGYAIGYRTGASGEPCPDYLANAPLPGDVAAEMRRSL